MRFDPERAADALLALRRARAVMERLPDDVAPRSEADGVATQHALARRLGADPPGGFKIGATAKVMQDYLGLSGPAAGFMPAAGLHPSGAQLRFADFLAPGVECELGVRLAHDLPPGPCSSEQAARAVGELFAAIEIVERRYADLARFGTPSMIADQVFHAAAVLGTPAPDWALRDLLGLPGRIRVDGEERGHGVGGDLLGGPLQALAWLAGSPTVAAFGGLRAGQVIMLGSVTPPIWLERPGTIEVAFAGLAPVLLVLA